MLLGSQGQVLKMESLHTFLLAAVVNYYRKAKQNCFKQNKTGKKENCPKEMACNFH